MYTAKVHDRAVQWRRGWNLTPYKKVGCADWILSGRLSCYSGNIAIDISYIIRNYLPCTKVWRNQNEKNNFTYIVSSAKLFYLGRL